MVELENLGGFLGSLLVLPGFVSLKQSSTVLKLSFAATVIMSRGRGNAVFVNGRLWPSVGLLVILLELELV